MAKTYIKIDLILEICVSFTPVPAEPSTGLSAPTITDVVILDNNHKPMPVEIYNLFTQKQIEQIEEAAMEKYYDGE